MKKINKIKKSTKIKSKQFSKRNNPIINDFGKFKDHLVKLLGENVILHMYILPDPIIAIRGGEKKQIIIYGTLDINKEYIPSDCSFIVYFNPLNQYQFGSQSKKKNERIGHNHLEEHMMMENELEFMYNEPTMKVEFRQSQINYIEDNEIFLFSVDNYNRPQFLAS